MFALGTPKTTGATSQGLVLWLFWAFGFEKSWDKEQGRKELGLLVQKVKVERRRKMMDGGVVRGRGLFGVAWWDDVGSGERG